MYTNRVLKLLLHPFFIGLVITVGLLLLTPPWFNKFRIKEISRDFLTGKDFYYYEDLNNDGYSEKILIDRNNPFVMKFILFSNNKIVSNCNLNQMATGGEYLYFGNFDENDNKELFVFTIQNDSIYLNIMDLFSENPYILRKRYLDFQRPGKGEAELAQVDVAGLYDFDADGTKELVFSINTGYRKQPRNCFLYNIRNDVLLISPESGASIIEPEIYDLTGDTVPEIIFGTIAPGNTDFSFPYSDQYSWFMALDHNLQFLFEPLRFNRHPCYLSVVPLNFDSLRRIIILNYYFGFDSIPTTLGLYTEKGKYKRHIQLEAGKSFSILPGAAGTFYLIGSNPPMIELRDTSFQVLREISSPEFYFTNPEKTIDADGDGSNEYIYKGNEAGLYYIVSNDFSSFTSINLGIELNNWKYFGSLIQTGNNPPLLYVPFEQGGISFKYAENPLYKFRNLIYTATFLFITGLLYLVYLMQRYLARMQYEAKRKMNELQLLSVKSQMDPHFTFNVLNSIGSLYSQTENRKSADYLFGKYARLLRETIIASDQTEVTLLQELDFIKNYLDIEKFRLDNNFNYSVKTDKDVDTGLKIPRMLIHTFAENAVKYAIRQVEKDARLDINIKKTNGKLYIILTDNGPGFKGIRKTDVAGTGKGLAIIDEMSRLYYEMTGVKIGYSLVEVIEDGECRGMRAEIIINLKIGRKVDNVMM
jgi:hypothetical protein